MILDIEIYQQRLEALEIDKEELVHEFYQMKNQHLIYQKDFRDVLNHPTYALPFLQPGRLIKISQKIGKQENETDFGWGIIVNFQKTFKKSKDGDLTAIGNEGPVYVLDVLLHCAPGTEAQNLPPNPSQKGEKGDLIVVPCSLQSINGLSSVRVYIPKEIKSQESRKQLLKTLFEVEKRFADKVPLLDPIKDMGIKDDAFLKLVQVFCIHSENRSFGKKNRNMRHR